MVADFRNPAHSEALRLLDGFAKAGAKSFDLTITTINDGKVRYLRSLPYAKLSHMIPDLLKNSGTRRHNVIVRPNMTFGIEHIQRDDLAAGLLERVRPSAFLCLQTSPGNFQAWVAIPDGGDPD